MTWISYKDTTNHNDVEVTLPITFQTIYCYTGGAAFDPNTASTGSSVGAIQVRAVTLDTYTTSKVWLKRTSTMEQKLLVIGSI